MYEQYYGLQGRPFQLTPDPHYYFESATHRKALSYLGYGLAQGEGFIVITGDIGAGKTTLVGHLMQTIDPARLTAVKIVSTQVEGDDMLRLAAQSFGLATEGFTKAATLQKIEGYLHGQARAGRRSLLIVDEAQNLGVSAIEELRMLSNFQLGGQSLLQIFLLGQPEFRDLLRSPDLEQLRQRVIATHHLEPMLPSEVEPYVIHRLGIAGWAGDPAFTPAAFSALYAATGGVPRRLNALISRVLLLGAIEQIHEIDADAVAVVVADMGLDIDVMPAPVAASALDDVAEADIVEAAEDSVAPEPADADVAGADVTPAEPVARAPWHDAAEADEDTGPAELVEGEMWDVDTAESDEDAAAHEPVAEQEEPLPAWTPAPFAAPAEQAEEIEAIGEEELARPAPFARPAAPSGRWDMDAQIADMQGALDTFDEEDALTEVHAPDEASIAVDADDDADDRAENMAGLRRDMQDEIAALRAEIASLRAMQSHAPFNPPQTIDPEALKDCFTLIEERLASLEFRAEEHDAALRRVLTMLVEWVEREDRMDDVARDAAVA